MTTAPAKGHVAEDGATGEDGSNRVSATPDTDPTKGSQRRRRRWPRRLLLSLGGVVVVFVAATLALFVFPPTDHLHHVDGILSLNGGDEQAHENLRRCLSPRRAMPRCFSSLRVHRPTTQPCPKVPRVSVVCFFDATNNTRGEARWAGNYAKRHHWHSLLIVPGRIQARRARLLTERCFSGQVLVDPATEPLREIPGDVLHEWGGLLAALVIYRGC